MQPKYDHDPAFVQGTNEWLELRKTKITASDAAVILGVSPWKTKRQLYDEKVGFAPPPIITDRMQRGIDLEPIARELFCIQTGIEVEPDVVVKEWAMASLDGISKCRKHIVEIKCPGEKQHSIALSGKVPDYYYAQMQHQMWVCDVDEMWYFSFDGSDGVTVKVKQDRDYTNALIEAEHEFYQCILNQVPPEDDYTTREDEVWRSFANLWITLSREIKGLVEEQEELKKKLVFLSGESNSRGGGISLCQVKRKGNVDYSKIPELQGVDLDAYRGEEITSWRITTQ